MTTTQFFAVSNFINYAQVDAIGSTTGMDQDIIHTVLSTHHAKITSYINNETGEGWEIREITH